MPEHLIPIEEAREDLLACAAFLAEDIKSADGYAEAMKKIVPAYLAKADVDLAAEFANTVDDPFTRDRLLTLVAEKCAALDDDEYALQLAEAIEDVGSQEYAKELIAVQKAEKGDYEKALAMADQISHPSHALGIIAAKMDDAGEHEKALEILRTIDDAVVKTNYLQLIAFRRKENGETETALNLIEEAHREAKQIEHAEEKIRALQTIAHSFGEMSRRDRSIEVLAEAKQSAERLEGVYRDNLLAEVSLAFMHAGSVDLADRTLDLVADKTQTASALTGFAREFWATGENAEAVEALEEAYQIIKSQHERETRDSRAKFALLTTIAVLFAQFEKPERAIEIAQENQDETQASAALSQIAQVLAAQDRDDLARQAIKAIAEDSERMFALIGASDAKNRAGKKDESAALLNEAAHLAETVPQLSVRSSAFNELARRFHEYSDGAKARGISHENLTTIAQIRDESTRAVALTNLADVYEQANFDLTDAEKEILHTMVRRAEW